jgi:hypothetical protein
MGHLKRLRWIVARMFMQKRFNSRVRDSIKGKPRIFERLAAVLRPSFLIFQINNRLTTG